MAISGYIIEAYNCMGSAYTCRRLAEEAVALGMDVRLVGVHDTRIHNGRLYNGDDVLEIRDFAICFPGAGKGGQDEECAECRLFSASWPAKEDGSARPRTEPCVV